MRDFLNGANINLLLETNKGFAPVLVLLIVLGIIVVGGGAYYAGKGSTPVPVQNPDTTPPNNIVGGDKDEHGCIGSAGYSWCEVKNKCLRTWEEKCENSTPIVDSDTIEKANGIIKTVYSKSGKNYIDIDYIELNPNWAPGGMSGSAYQNNNPKIRTFEISSSAKFVAGSPATNFVTFSQFQNFFSPSNSSYQKSNPWDIVVTNGVVVEVTEHFIN